MDCRTPKHPKCLLTTAGVLALISMTEQVTAQVIPGNSSLVSVPQGYQIQPLVSGLDFPTSITFSTNRAWVSEAGFFSEGLLPLPPRVREIGTNANLTTILTDAMLPQGVLAGPITDVTFHNGQLWIAHRQQGTNGWLVGAISRFDPDNAVASFTTVITGLPSSGDWYTEDIEFDNAGRGYFAQGTASNSGVIGPDNEIGTRWLSMFPAFHDFAPVELELNGVAFTNTFPFPLDANGTAVTAPFHRFNSGAVAAGTTVPAATPTSPQEGIIAGNGTVYSFDATATNATSSLRLEAWGLRNPYGLAFDPLNPTRLFVSNNGADVRSVLVNGEPVVAELRPINNDGDDMFVIDVGGTNEFFGWPDFFHHPRTGEPLSVTNEIFCVQEDVAFPCPPSILDPEFRDSLNVESAFAQLPPHVAATKFDFSTAEEFRHVGDMFVSLSGSFVPITGALEFVGYKVVRVDRQTGTVHDFITPRGQTPAELFNPAALNKPIDVKFRGNTMVVLDFGVFEPGLALQQPGTGKIWLVTPAGGGASIPTGGTPRSESGTIRGTPVPNLSPIPSNRVTPGRDPARTNSVDGATGAGGGIGIGGGTGTGTGQPRGAANVKPTTFNSRRASSSQSGR